MKQHKSKLSRKKHCQAVVKVERKIYFAQELLQWRERDSVQN